MEQRYESAREFYEALEEFVARQPLLASPAEVPSTSTKTDVPTPAEKKSAWALVNTKADANEKYALDGEVMVGRDRTCSIVLTHPAVSRRHAKITLSGASCVLEDLKSANGTYVNNARVERANLKPGDVVRFGADPTCSFVLRDH
jgi:hypothetical protein